MLKTILPALLFNDNSDIIKPGGGEIAESSNVGNFKNVDRNIKNLSKVKILKNWLSLKSLQKP